MTLSEADSLLSQWAKWSAGELSPLGYKPSVWQRLCESGFQEEAAGAAVADGDDEEMLEVDATLCRLSYRAHHHYRVLRHAYLKEDGAHDLHPGRLEAAQRAFINEWLGVLDKSPPLDSCTVFKTTVQ